MNLCQMLVVSLLVTMFVLAAVGDTRAEIIFRKPVPEGVAEIAGIGAEGGIVALKDGSLMLAQGNSYRLSADGGVTWDEAEPLNCEIGASELIRLLSGALAIYGTKGDNRCFASSTDEGKTWSQPSVICPASAGAPLYHSMIQLSTGRLLFTMHGGGGRGTHPDLDYTEKSAYGLWRGQRIQIEGHGHMPEMGISIVYRSDDEGKTWEVHPCRIMGWFDFEGIPNGYCGQTSCYEPAIVEAKNGGALLIARSTVGRLVQSYSPDGGDNWYAVRPTELASSESPAGLVRIPQTGDLLIVWNQVSREEIRRGYRRGRLSAAISKDGGHSWENFKTLELSDGLEDIDRVTPEYPIQMVRARDWAGALPDDWAWFHYAAVDVVGDKVYIRYLRGYPLLGVAEQYLKKQYAVMRIYPLEWFYE